MSGPPPLLPPFTAATARAKVKRAQLLWNSKNPSLISPSYTPTSVWRNRSTFLQGRAEIESFLATKFAKEKRYRLRKELFAFQDNRIAVEFWYEYYSEEEDEVGGKGWRRCYGIEHWTFDEEGLMSRRVMSGNEQAIEEGERWFAEGVEDVDSVQLPGASNIHGF